MDLTCEQCTTAFTSAPSRQRRFCSPACFDDHRRLPLRMCEYCGILPMKKGSERFCSNECAAGARRTTPDRTCPQCGDTFRRDRMQAKFCSIECQHQASHRLDYGPCLQCGATKTKPLVQYCSPECIAIARNYTRKACPVCQATVRVKRLTYCSNACAAKARVIARDPCKQCGSPIGRKGNQFCSVRCAWDARMAPRPCIVCGTNPARSERRTCSAECTARSRRRVRNPLYTDDLVAQIRKLRGEGVKLADVAAQTGMREGQIGGLIGRNEIAFYRPARPPKEKAPPKPRVVRVAAPKPPKQIVIKPVAAKPSTPRPVSLRLREVYQWGATLNVPSELRGNIAAVSRAMRRDDPTHPGFVLATPGNWMTHP